MVTVTGVRAQAVAVYEEEEENGEEENREEGSFSLSFFFCEGARSRGIE